MTWHCLLKTECAEALVANGASRPGVRQLLAAFRLPEPGRPECASADAFLAKIGNRSVIRGIGDDGMAAIGNPVWELGEQWE